MRRVYHQVAFVLLAAVWSGLCFALLMLPSVLAQGSRPPLCDVTCGPDPSSPSYGGTIQARPLSHNGRGRSSVLARPAPGSPQISETLPGSESYNYAIPILNLPGRNGLDLNLTLYYNSRVWTIDKVNNTASFNADRDFPSYGFRLGFGYLEGPFPNGVGTQSYLLTEPDGGKRELRLKAGTIDVYESFDSSYLTYNSSYKLLFRKDGTQWWYEQVGTSTFFRPKYIKDTNGNFLTFTYRDDLFPNAPASQAQAINTITDTLGRIITFNYDANKRLASITGPAFGTGTRTFVSFAWSQIALNYNFGSPLTVVDTVATGTPTNVITECRYKDNSSANNAGYTFEYGDWGIIKKINQISSLGTPRSFVSYNYPTAAAALSDHPAFTQQTVAAAGAGTANWNYAVTKTSGLVSAFSITGPTVGGVATTTTTNLYTAGWQTGLVSSVTIQSGATPLRTMTNTWMLDTTGQNPHPWTVAVTLDDGQQSMVEFTYTAYGNVSEVREYDYGPVLKRRTQTDYLTSASYINQHILDRPTQVRVYDGGGALKSRLDLAYDSTSPTSVPGAAQHDDIYYGPTFLTRGNLTAVTRYANAAAASGPITRNFYYDTLGNLLKAQLDCCQERTWGFTSATQYAYPETITSGPLGTQLSVSRSYDSATGLVSTATDENNKVTSFQYDSMNRLTAVTRPDGASLTTSYDDAPAQPTVTSTTPIDASNSLVQVTTTDGLGRPIKQETRSGGGTPYSIVDIQNDLLGRPSQISNPYAPGGTVLWTVNTYDALSRITQVTPPGSAGSYQYNYSSQVGGSQSWCPGTAVTVTDPAGKQRRTCSDAFGRLVQVHEPGNADGASGSGWVTINGSLQHKITGWDCSDPYEGCQPILLYDSGAVSVTVNGFTATAGFGEGSTTASMAADLRTAFNTSSASPVTASGTGATITLVAKQAGVQTNYSLSVAWSWDTSNFTNPSFTAAKSGNTLTGGADGATGTPSINTPLVTVNNYDALDNLTQVIQGVQTRTFNYDSLSRLTSATTPEAGTASYTYTSFSQVATRTDPRNVVTSYSYDPLNRLSQASYNTVGTSAVATPTVSFTYGTSPASNNNGRLWNMTDGLGTESYTYDLLGRITQVNRVIDGVSYPIGYAYNQASELTSLTYPSGRQVQQAYDPIGRLNRIWSGTPDYLSNVAYNAASEPTGFNYGNGVAASFSYNARMQLATLRYSKAPTDLLNLTYNYGSGNNGQITGITDNLVSIRTLSYTYDAWSRLKTAATAGGSPDYPAFSLSWDYDRFGNRRNQNANPGLQTLLTIDPATNRATQIGSIYTEHDPAGNMTKSDLNRYKYDAESRLRELRDLADTTVLASYSYDGAGLRVKKVAGGTTTVYVYSGTKVIAEYVNGAAPSAPTREYIYAGSQLVATHEGTTLKYHHSDHLSVRLTTDSNPNANPIVIGQQGHYPFGEQWYPTSGTPATKWQFTSYERDPESLLDYAGFRYDASRLGRFMTPDPVAGSLLDPQSLNRYAYVRNDPINLIDPLGLQQCQWVCTTVCTGPPDHENCGSETCTWDCANPYDASVGESFESSARRRFIALILAGFERMHLREPGESISDCVKRVGSSYSAAGIATLVSNVDFEHNFAAEMFLGNDVFAVAGIFGIGPESGVGVLGEGGLEDSAWALQTQQP